MNSHVYKTIQVTGTSTSSADDALRTAVERAAVTVHNLKWSKSRKLGATSRMEGLLNGRFLSTLASLWSDLCFRSRPECMETEGSPVNGRIPSRDIASAAQYGMLRSTLARASRAGLSAASSRRSNTLII
jgi:hypothetical protein